MPNTTNTGSTNTGSTNTGSTNTGSTNTGSTNTGSKNTGSTNTGSKNTGSKNTGSKNTPQRDGYVDGTAANDTIISGYTDTDGDQIDNGDAILPGEANNDDIVLAGAGNDFVMANDGDDEIYGGTGDDTLCGQDGDDVIYGGAGNDIIEGMKDNDVLIAGAGSDTIYGDAGNDVMSGGVGDDKMYGGTGEDVASGGKGADFINMGSGNDVAYGGVGGDSILGGDGDDTLFGGNMSYDGTQDFNDLSTGELVDGQYIAEGVTITSSDPRTPVMAFDTANPTGGDNDLATANLGKVLILSEDRDGSDPDDNASGGTFNITFENPASVTSLTLLDVEEGAWVKYYDMDGNLLQQVDVSTANNGQHVVTTDLHNVASIKVILAGSGAIDNLSYSIDPDNMDGDDVINGGIGEDYIEGNAGNDIIYSGDGDDTVFGGSGNDMVFSGVGNDTLYGEDGNDKLEGSGGEDKLYGGEGDDDLWGGANNDLIIGGVGNDSANGGGGDDIIRGGAGNDVLEGHNNNDMLFGGRGDDSLFGGSGDDKIEGGSGNDVIEGGLGNDDLWGASGDDSVYGGRGNDTIMTAEGKDYVEGGDGNDIIDTGNDENPFTTDPGQNLPDQGYPGQYTADLDPNDDLDTVFGGAGSDTISTGDDDDTIYGGTGNDQIDAGIDDDYVEGGDGDDTIIGSEGNDEIYGGEDDDTIYGGLTPGGLGDAFNLPDDIDGDGDSNDPGEDLITDNNNDTLFGGAGNDTIFGADDDDTLFGGIGDDVLDGGVDDDTLYGDEGNDAITGGQGNDDQFGGTGSDVFLGGNGGDVVTGGEDADGSDVDVLDLTGSGVETITYVAGDPEAGTVTFLDGSTMTFSEIENVVPCFTPGTTIATPKGERLVEDLQEGDRIITRDNGIQEIRWVGRKEMSGKALVANPHLKPILVRAGSLGNGLPERDMLVSPNHRMLVASEKTQLYFEEREVLAAAKHLVGSEGIHAVDVMGTAYIHFMFDRHEVVLSNGAWTESFQPGDYTLKGIGNAQRNEIFELFPELSSKVGLAGYQSARRALKKHEAALLAK